MELLAHIRTGENGDFENQTLKEHCLSTAKYSAEAMKNIGLYNTGYLAGLLHDFGKATNTFNNFLKNSVMGKEQTSSKVIHTFQGAIYLLENYHNVNAYEKITCEILAYAVGSHHGLFDCVDFDGRNGFCHRLDKDKNEISYDEAKENFLKNVCDEEEIGKLFHKSVEEIAAKCRSINIKLKDGVRVPSSVDDYEIEINNLEGLEVEVIPGI